MGEEPRLAEIVTIGGSRPGKRALPGEPVPEVVEELESLLARAKSGEIVAVGVGYVMDHGGVIKMDGAYAYRGLTSSDLLVAVALMKRKFEDRIFAPVAD